MKLFNNLNQKSKPIDNILLSFCVYIVVFFLSWFLKISTPFLGAFLFLVLISLSSRKYIFSTKINAISICIFYCMLFGIIPLFSYDKFLFLATAQELIKYYALLFVILIASSIPQSSISRSKTSKLLYFTILFLLVLSWLFQVGYQSDPAGRVSGFLANANNFALTAMLLLFLIDMEKGSPIVWIITHGIVFFLICISQTSGALLGYLAGLVYYLLNNKKHKVFVIVSVIILSFFFIMIFSFSEHIPIKAIQSVSKKISFLKDNYENVFADKQVDFYGSIVQEKGDYTSALWRLVHWTRIVKRYLNSSIDKILFGYGIGTTDVFFGIKSHNDYLRLIFEGGVLSFSLNIILFGLLYRRMDKKSKWIVVGIAVYSFTENNYDNFLAMSLLVFYMIGNKVNTELPVNG